MKKVLVIGGSGMVASRFTDLVKDKFEITSADEKTLDITNKEAVDDFFEKNIFDVVINFAAFTNVDGAETEKDNKEGIVWRLNVDAPGYLAESCKNKDMFLIHISTDFVFTGNEANPGPYLEESQPPDSSDGLGWYGWTKNRAEKVVSESGSRHAIIRYGYPFRPDKYDLKLDWARNLLKLYNEHKLYPLFTDQTQSVVFIDDLVAPFAMIIENENEGIFHIASKDTTSPYEIGSYLLDKYAGTHVELEKGLMSDFLKAPGRTPRPKLGGLSVEKTERVLGMQFRTWREMVDDFIGKIHSSSI
jgi:dTDP-4-dehydrorhamnose reductase